jgi:3-phytase
MFRPLRFEALESRQLLAPVTASVETTQASGAADDTAIWIHPTDPAQSRVIGAIKSGSSSLEVYRLDGTRVQSITAGDINNVDLRYNFPTAEGPITLLAGSDRSSDTIALYRVNSSGQLTSVAARPIGTGIDVYGCAMYVSPVSGKHFVFISSESGDVQQWELFEAGGGKVDAVQVRNFDVGRITEGLVADDVSGYLYVGEEDVGIWRYSAEPTGGTARMQIDSTGGSGYLRADVEGLAIFYRPEGQGYLIASSQGSNDFVVYQQGGNNAYVGRFNIIAGVGIDAVADTDGIDVTNFNLGGAFGGGMFVAQDSDVNFKLVSWNAIAIALEGAVEIDTRWDPRQVGADGTPASSQGDFNEDGIVNAADFVVWRNGLGSSVAPYSSADANGSGSIDEGDYVIWKANYGQFVGTALAADVDLVGDRSPEPVSPSLWWSRPKIFTSPTFKRERWITNSHVDGTAGRSVPPFSDYDLMTPRSAPRVVTAPLAGAGTSTDSPPSLAEELAWEGWGSDEGGWSATRAWLAAFAESIPASNSR